MESELKKKIILASLIKKIKMVKKILISMIALFSLGFSYAQDVKIDSRLEARYTKEELNSLQKNNAKELSFLTYCIENAYSITPFPVGKSGVSELGSPIRITDLNAVNFFQLGLNIKNVEWQYFPVEGTDKLLVVYSRETIMANMKKK